MAEELTIQMTHLMGKQGMKDRAILSNLFLKVKKFYRKNYNQHSRVGAKREIRWCLSN